MGFCPNPGVFPGLGLLLLICAGPALADPITRTCDYQGPGKLGPLTVTADETAKRIVVTTALGATWVSAGWRHDRIPPARRPTTNPTTSKPSSSLSSPTGSKSGIRNPDDGATVHMSYFNRSALNSPNTRCVWKSLWGFRRV